jgi:predicted membrane protein
MTEEEFSRLVKQLVKYEKKLSSLWWNFCRGVVYGLGFFIGSAILAAVLIYILGRVDGNGFIGRYFHDIITIIKNPS